MIIVLGMGIILLLAEVSNTAEQSKNSKFFRNVQSGVSRTSYLKYVKCNTADQNCQQLEKSTDFLFIQSWKNKCLCV